MIHLETRAKHAHASFGEHVQSYPADVREQLETFLDMDELDQAAVVLHLARYAPSTLDLAYRSVNDLPCWESPLCGHPRHVGECEVDECGCYR